MTPRKADLVGATVLIVAFLLWVGALWLVGRMFAQEARAEEPVAIERLGVPFKGSYGE